MQNRKRAHAIPLQLVAADVISYQQDSEPLLMDYNLAVK